MKCFKCHYCGALGDSMAKKPKCPRCRRKIADRYCIEVEQVGKRMTRKRLIQNRWESKHDFRTPQFIFEGAMDMFDVFFTLDVAASNENRLCNWYMDEEMNALSQRWWGHVWCNPPYNDISPWVDKAICQLQEGNILTCTFLVPASTCTYWFEKLWSHAKQIIFISGRLKFEGPNINSSSKAAATNPSVLVHLTRDHTGGPDVRMINSRGGELSDVD